MQYFYYNNSDIISGFISCHYVYVEELVPKFVIWNSKMRTQLLVPEGNLSLKYDLLYSNWNDALPIVCWDVFPWPRNRCYWLIIVVFHNSRISYIDCISVGIQRYSNMQLRKRMLISCASCAICRMFAQQTGNDWLGIKHVTYANEEKCV
jgi:hypothetical protein